MPVSIPLELHADFIMSHLSFIANLKNPAIGLIVFDEQLLQSIRPKDKTLVIDTAGDFLCEGNALYSRCKLLQMGLCQGFLYHNLAAALVDVKENKSAREIVQNDSNCQPKMQ